MTKESIQLKNVKIAWHMSEGTTAFTASLYIDGKKAADVKNEGRGETIIPGSWTVNYRRNSTNSARLSHIRVSPST